jgi:hypothetical protein
MRQYVSAIERKGDIRRGNWMDVKATCRNQRGR